MEFSKENFSKFLKTAEHFTTLKKKVLISDHKSLIAVFIINKTKHTKHPHKNKRVYMSRMALKHFTENRMENFMRSYSREKSLSLVMFLLNNLVETVSDFDKYEYEPPNNHFYIKEYYEEEKPSVIKVLLEEKNSWLEIISIHPSKRSKK